jgi:hemolysin activation/secretion protein
MSDFYDRRMTNFLRRLCAVGFCALLSCSALGQQDAPSETKPHFDVFEFQVEGNTVLANDLIERAVYPFMGEGRSIDDVEAARTALEQVYRDRGYATVAVDIPPQKVVGGTIVLNVVEGRIARLRVQGSRYYSQDRIVAAVPALAEGSVPRLPEAQKQLAAVNTTLDKRVTPLLRPGKAPGTTEVDLQVEDQFPLHGSVEFNNHQSPNTTASRVLASLRYANLFQREHTIGLQFQTSPQNDSEVQVFVGSYSLPVGDGTLVLSAVRSNSSSFVGGGIGVFGKGNTFGLRYLLPLGGDGSPPGLSQSLTLGLDYKDFKQSLSLNDTTGFKTPIRYMPFSLNYSGQRIDDSGVTEFGAGLVFAFRGLASKAQQFEDKRFQAKSSFVIAKFNLGRTQKLPRDYSFYASIDGQASGQPLVSNEQFIVGGVDSVRGYLESTQAGDVGLRGTLELRSPSLVSDEGRIDFVQWRAFFDIAHVLVRAPLPGTSSTFGLSSAGAGLTVKAKPGFSLRADLAWPLRDSTFQQAYSPRLQASAAFEF